MSPRRAAFRRTARRTSRRTARRVIRRKMRRRLLVGGMVALAAGGAAAAIKMTQQDANRIEQHTGVSVEELTEEELADAMRDLGIQSIAIDENDQAVINQDSNQELAFTPTPIASSAPITNNNSSLADEIERLADLRDRGVISDADFEAVKNKLLGI